MIWQERSTQERILTSAKEKFLKQGFQHTSLRSIVEGAGVTTGAMYGYYRSKEALFNALVEETYQYLIAQFQEALTAFDSLPLEEQPKRLGTYSRACMQGLLDYVYGHRDEVRLLLLCAEGTQYAHLKEELVALEIAATHKYYATLNRLKKPSPNIDKRLEHILVTGLINAYFEIVLHDMPMDDAKHYVSELLDFYNTGWAKIISIK